MANKRIGQQDLPLSSSMRDADWQHTGAPPVYGPLGTVTRLAYIAV